MNVKQDNLNSFLAVAERLRVRGLCQNDSSSSSNSNNSKSSRLSQAEKPKHSRLSEPTGSSSFTEPSIKRPRVSHDDDIEEIPPAPVVKQELSDPSNRSQSSQQEDYQLAETYDESMQGSEYGEEYYEDDVAYSAAEGAMMDPSQSKGRNPSLQLFGRTLFQTRNTSPILVVVWRLSLRVKFNTIIVKQLANN